MSEKKSSKGKWIIWVALTVLAGFFFVKSGMARAAYLTFFHPIRTERAVRRISNAAEYEKYEDMDIWSYMLEEEEAAEEATEPEDEDHNAEMLALQSGIVSEDDRAAFLEKLSGCMPYIGMDEAYVDLTVVGPHNYDASAEGRTFDTGYVWRLGPERNDVVLTVGCTEGKVSFIGRGLRFFSDRKYWDDGGMPLFSKEETARWYTEEEIQQKTNEAKYDSEVQKYDTAEAYAEVHAPVIAERLRAENAYRLEESRKKAYDRQSIEDDGWDTDEEMPLEYYMDYDGKSESVILEEAWRQACDYWHRHHIDGWE